MNGNTEFNIPDGPQPGAPGDIDPQAAKLAIISTKLNEHVQRTKGQGPTDFEQAFVLGYIAGIEVDGQALAPEQYDPAIAKALEAAAPLHG